MKLLPNGEEMLASCFSSYMIICCRYVIEKIIVFQKTHLNAGCHPCEIRAGGKEAANSKKKDLNISCFQTGSDIVVAEISNWVVTIIQATAATLVGIYVVSICRCKEGKTDIVYGCRCRIVEVYLWVLWSYFVSDVMVLFKIHKMKQISLENKNGRSFIFQGLY